MLRTEAECLDFLARHGLRFERMEHPPVFTCAEADLYWPAGEAAATKNLFLCDKKARHFFLVVTTCERTVDLERLAMQIGVPRLRFGSEENLQQLLGVRRGAVTLMGLLNDTEHRVELWVEAELWQAERFLVHPLVNTATLVLSRQDLLRFLSITGHAVHFFT